MTSSWDLHSHFDDIFDEFFSALHDRVASRQCVDPHQIFLIHSPCLIEGVYITIFCPRQCFLCCIRVPFAHNLSIFRSHLSWNRRHCRSVDWESFRPLSWMVWDRELVLIVEYEVALQCCCLSSPLCLRFFLKFDKNINFLGLSVRCRVCCAKDAYHLHVLSWRWAFSPESSQAYGHCCVDTTAN